MIPVVSNWQTERCGIQAFGADLVAALRYAGIHAAVWHWDDRTPRYAASCVIYNWHPHTALGVHPPNGPAIVIAHEVPSHEDVVWPIWFHRPNVLVLVGEPFEDYPVFRYPSLDYVSPNAPVEGRLGTTGIRGDGVELLRQAAAAIGWEFSASPTDRFATRQEEIDRLAACDVVALWYWASGRAQSLALPVAAAAMRPLVLTESTMLDFAPPSANRVPWTDDVAAIGAHIQATTRPIRPSEHYTWSHAIADLRRLGRDSGLTL